MRFQITNCFFIAAISLSILLQTSCKNNKANPEAISVKDTLKALAGNQYQNIDQSPMDVSYCPADYPQNKMKKIVDGGPVARVIYSRPHKKGRVIFSEDSSGLCQYGKPWRLGANEATEIELFRPVLVGGKNMEAGRYILYGIPYADKWIIVFNSNVNSWGLEIDPDKDIFRTELPVQNQSNSIEDFTMVFQDRADGADLMITWDKVKVLMPFTFSK